MFKKILVPTDGSNSSKAALAKAIDLAKETGAEIVLYHSTIRPESYREKVLTYGGVPLCDKEITAAGLGVMKETLKGMNTEGINISTVAEVGKPAKKIIDYANTGGFDLVVIGSVGHGAFSGALLGSVSQKVAGGSKVPVMVVKDDENQAYVMKIFSNE